MTHLPVSSEQQNLRMHVYLYVGDHLLPIHRLKLATLCDRFIKYVEYGGKNSIAKLYHEYD